MAADDSGPFGPASGVVQLCTTVSIRERRLPWRRVRRVVRRGTFQVTARAIEDALTWDIP